MALLISTGAMAQSYDQSELDLFKAMRRQPNQLARYQYLVQAMPQLSVSEQIVAGQFLSFSLNELGLYNQAVLSFPLESERPPGLVLPTGQDQWKSADAVDVITKLAADRRIVMINEAHHNAHTRALTLALLPRLRSLGFTYFAAEALGDNDADLMRRGYPIKSSGTEYLQEPLYGEIVREAIRLGFILVPYDSSVLDPQARDAAQAENLYQKVFAKDPKARLFVHAGYAHIDKASGRLNDVQPMAMKLSKLTGLDPLSIDQTQFLESGLNTLDDYHVLMDRFPARSAEILINRVTGKPWSASPELYDLNVISPMALDAKTFGDDKWSVGGRKVENVAEPGRVRLFGGLLIAPDEMPRAKWSTLDGQRYPFPITTELCKKQSPCAISAQYIDESADASPADIYAFFEPYASSKLYLRPGRYRLRAWNANGKTLSEQAIQISEP